MRPGIGAMMRVYPILNISLGLFQGGCRIIIILLADRLINEQFSKAFGPRPYCGKICLGPSEGGIGIVERCLKRCWVNPVEHLASFDVGTFRKQAFLYDTADLGPDFRNKTGRCTARQFSSKHDLLRMYRYCRYFCKRNRRLRFLPAVTAARYKTEEKNSHNGN